jgi:CubicO group peptidase (beta-lactamase class C family)
MRLQFKAGFITGLILICAGFSLLAQDRALVQVGPAQVGMSETGLAQVSRFLQSEVDAGRIGGAVGMVARHGQIAYFDAFGDCQKDSLFRLASMTKTITSAGVMKLVEEGSLKLTDEVARYIPEFANARAYKEGSSDSRPASREITIHDLMSHTSGLGYSWFGPEAQDKAYRENNVGDIAVPIQEKLEERIERLGPLPLAFNPGTNWYYGLSSDVLGRVIEVVSGLQLDIYFHERIFRPLKMTDTQFYVPDSQRDRLAPFYAPDANQKAVRVKDGEILASGPINYSADYCYEGNGSVFLGGSGLVGSTMDYMRFLQCLLNGGRLEDVSPLRRESVAMMTRNQIGNLAMPFPGHGDGWGYGFGVLTERGKENDVASVGTFSWGGLYNTYFWVDPQEELIGLVMTQIFPYDHLSVRSDFKRLVYEAIDDSGFSRRYYYTKGVENGNPHFNGRQLRVNSSNVVVHPNFASRSEPRSPGLARVLIEEDLRTISGANLYCEIWGGHAGTFNKTVTVNGRVKLKIPDEASADHNCSHNYPRFSLAPTDLVNGYNALQFNCDRENMGWGHYIVDTACLEIRLPRDHKDLVAAGLSDFSALVKAKSSGEKISLELDSSNPSAISKVVYQARYTGYDENGNGWQTDWHGMTKEREAYGMLGTSENGPFKLDWDVSMLPAQSGVEVRAFVYLKESPKLVFQSQVTGGLEIGSGRKDKVSLYLSDDLAKPFWSRANKLKECTINLDVDPATIESAQLHVVVWTGGAGEVKEYFTLNDKFFPVAEGESHDLYYHIIALDPKLLKKGANTIKLLSDTEHHGIEVMLPGPALMIRSHSN